MRYTDQSSVHEYHGFNGQLLLRNQYPTSTTDVPTALVNIDKVLSRDQRDLLEVGAWLNVIGNVEWTSKSRVTGSPSKTQTVVTATMIWSAGAIKLEDYEAAVKDYQKPLGTE